MKAFVWACLFWAASINAIAELQINTFTSGSYSQIVKQYQGQPFIMVLWSLDCPPCYKELGMLAAEHKQNPFNLVLISVDGIDAISEVEAMLEKYQLQNVNTWLFEETAAQHLRYEIDPLWYGELPRSYLFNKSRQRQAVSGVLSTEQVSKIIPK